MRLVGIFSILSVCVFSAKSTLIDRFEEWVQRFRYKFLDENHYVKIFTTWSSNDKFISEINSMNLTYTLGHNQFSGMDNAEYRNYLSLSGPYTNDGSNSYLVVEQIGSLPDSVNWVKKGGVTHVKDQGQCGSCWSFSTTGALEGAHFVKYGKMDSFSEQQLVDCDNYRNGGKDHGCKGGLMDNAFSWIQKNGGLCSELEYPYVSGETKTEGTCQTTCTVNKNSAVKGFTDVAPSSDDAMMSALNKQPVSIAIEADQREFQLYKSGVFTGTCGTKLDHGVLVVGYGSLSDQDYYLVKNSWSLSWGDNGYIMLGRGKQYNNGDGQCGMLLEGSYPTL
jgi:C1A family cysteine protease